MTVANPVTAKVNEFYNEMPFNFAQSAEVFAQKIRNGNSVQEMYPNLHDVLVNRHGKRAIDIGCGTGWFVNTVAYHYCLRVTGIDLCQPAIDRAMQLSKELGLIRTVEYMHRDIFKLDIEKKFYLVNSIGVLHHTYDCKGAVEAVSSMVDDNGYFHLALYHKYGREPFLNLFKPQRDKLAAGQELTPEEEQAAFEIFKELNFNVSDETLLRSWFRDQAIHPHETQHTFKETYEWFTALGFRVLSTSINNFAPFDDPEALFEEEKKYYDISIRKNVEEKSYFPGFFTVLARKEV